MTQRCYADSTMAGFTRAVLVWLAAMTSSALIAAGCEQAQPTPTPVPSPSPTATANPTPTPAGASSAFPARPRAAASLEIPLPQGGATPAWHEAVALFDEGLTLQYQGRLRAAVTTYRRSIETFPTAEGYTFLGWTYSWMGLFDEAIEEAKHAIEVDPDYGNPYNDIGLYLMELGRPDEAIPWLIEATHAERYAEPQFPHLNLGRIRLQKGQLDQALTSFEMVLLVRPDYTLPPLPSLVIDLPLSSGEIVGQSDQDRMLEVRQALEGYFEAWNAYDPDTLMGMIAEHSSDEKVALLLNLAGAKRAQHRVPLVGVEPLYLGEDAAVVRASVGDSGVVVPIPYVLMRDGDGWKVAGIAVMRSESAAGPTK